MVSVGGSCRYCNGRLMMLSVHRLRCRLDSAVSCLFFRGSLHTIRSVEAQKILRSCLRGVYLDRSLFMVGDMFPLRSRDLLRVTFLMYSSPLMRCVFLLNFLLLMHDVFVRRMFSLNDVSFMRRMLLLWDVPLGLRMAGSLWCFDYCYSLLVVMMTISGSF